MPTITSIVPSKVYNTVKYEDYKKLTAALQRLEPYSDTIKKVALLSNLPESLIQSIAVVPSFANITPATVKTITDPKKKTTKTALIGGICNVDYSALKAALIQEMKQGRLSEAEKNYLSEDPKLKAILMGTTKLVLPTPAAELKAPLFDLNKVQNCIMLSAIMLGQNIDATQNVETGLNGYFQKTDTSTADRNTRYCVAQYGTLDVLENKNRYTQDLPSMINGMRAVWIDESGNFFIGRNAKGELINFKRFPFINNYTTEFGVVKKGETLTARNTPTADNPQLIFSYYENIDPAKAKAGQGLFAIKTTEIGKYANNFVYNPALSEGVKNGVKSGFATMELALTDVVDPTTRSNFQQQINVLKQQAQQLKLI